MSYLNWSNGVPAFDKAVISFWFRVPQKSIDAARDAYSSGTLEGDTRTYPMFNGVIPLFVMGTPGTLGTYTSTGGVVDAFTSYTWFYDPVGGPTLVTNELARFGVPTPDYPSPGFTTDMLHIVFDSVANPNATGAGSYQVFEYSPGTNPRKEVETTNTAAGPAVNTDPTVIGVFCGSTSDPPQLYVNLQTGVKPEVKGIDIVRTKIEPGSQRGKPTSLVTIHVIYEMKYPHGIANDVAPADEDQRTKDFRASDDYQNVDHTAPDKSNLDPQVDTYTDLSSILRNRSATFSNNYSYGGSYFGGTDVQVIEADTWHHVLVSFEIKPCIVHGYDGEEENRPIKSNVDSTSKLWIALDDKNYTEFYLSPHWNEGGDPNEVLTEDARKMAGRPSVKKPQDDETRQSKGAFDILPDFNAACTSIDGTMMGLPASAGFVDNVFNVEMAEFQMWTGITLDTGVVENRRAFIDYKRAAGGEVDTTTLYPAGTKTAEGFMGRRPDVLLHGSGNWKAGKNTGTTGLIITENEDGTKTTELIPAGQFVPFGGIAQYKPDPSLVPPVAP